MLRVKLPQGERSEGEKNLGLRYLASLLESLSANKSPPSVGHVVTPTSECMRKHDVNEPRDSDGDGDGDDNECKHDCA